MMKCTCDICGKVICRAPFGELAKALREESSSRTTMRIMSRSEDSSSTNYDDICGECTDGILAYIARRKGVSE